MWLNLGLFTDALVIKRLTRYNTSLWLGIVKDEKTGFHASTFSRRKPEKLL
jgi:hypothetical protein